MNKTTFDSQPSEVTTLRQIFSTCGHCCQMVLNRLSAWKNTVESEFARTMKGYEQLLKASLNEAEALAWQTPYPHLFFPALAEEKAVEAQQWVLRQRRIWQQTQIQTQAASE